MRWQPRWPSWPSKNFLQLQAAAPAEMSYQYAQQQQRDPTDLSNVSVDGIQERMHMSRAAEAVKPRAAGKAPSSAAAGAGPSAAPPKKETKGEEKERTEQQEYEQRQELLDKIGRYRERFPKLKKRNGTLTIKTSLLELLDEAHYIEQQLGREEGPGGALKPANLCFIATMHGIEQGAAVYNPLKLQLSGLGNTTQQSIKQFEPLLDEFMIKHSMDMTASVEMRIVMLIATTVATVHMANSGHGTEMLAKLYPQATSAKDEDL
jgi:hypothetical protein